MMKIDYKTIVNGLRGIPIGGLVEGWSFKIEEIAPYVFKAQGQHVNWHDAIGYGSTPEIALNRCIKRAEKINAREARRIKVEKTLLKIIVKIQNALGVKK